MALDKQFPVYGDDGLKGTLFSPARFLDNATKKRVRLDDGRELLVPAEALSAEPDGSFYLKNASSFLLKPQTQAVAVGAEAPRADFLRPEPAPPLKLEETPIKMQSPTFADGFFRDDCEVKRVPVRRLIDKPVEPRQEGDTWIVPLVEEVLVVEKRLLLREELHITRRREKRSDLQPVRVEDLNLDGK